VQELVDQQNADPRRGEGPHALLKLLLIDDDAKASLKRAELELSSVPKDGEFVRLRRAANVASGGMPVSVLEKIHPDNRRLAVRAAQALRLDFAGVDLLITDIARSWRETGAGICEVNAQPNLGQVTSGHLYGSILRKLVPGNGRVATVVVLGASPENEIACKIATTFQDHGFVVGCHDADGVRIGDDVIMPKGVSTFAAGSALVAERQLGAMVVSVNDIGTLRTGLPFARYDVLVLAGRHIMGLDAAEKQEQQQLVLELFTSILPACDGRVVMLEGSGVKVQGLQRVTRARWDDVAITADQLVGEVSSEMMTYEAKHGDAVHRKPTPAR
jgi:cyanophycin synthetase